MPCPGGQICRAVACFSLVLEVKPWHRRLLFRLTIHQKTTLAGVILDWRVIVDFFWYNHHDMGWFKGYKYYCLSALPRPLRAHLLTVGVKPSTDMPQLRSEVASACNRTDALKCTAYVVIPTDIRVRQIHV